jgi:hypothetical protein
MIPVDKVEDSCSDENSKLSAREAHSLVEAFADIPDPRKARGIRYPLPSLLALCVVAFICGRQNLTQVRRFGKAHPDLLEDLDFPRPWRSPSVPTLSRVLGAVSIAQLQQAMARWFVGLVDSERKRRRCAVAAVDGKASRSAGVHVLNVFLHDVQQVVWQAPVDAKENEISAFKQALDDLFAAYPFLQILTGDAMFAGEPLCSSLIEHGRHYIFQIKADQKHLYEKMDLIFAAKLANEPDPAAFTGEKKRLRHRT